MGGSGYLFLMVMSFSPVKSIYGDRVLSFFVQKENPDPRGEEGGGADKACSQSH